MQLAKAERACLHGAVLALGAVVVWQNAGVVTALVDWVVPPYTLLLLFVVTTAPTASPPPTQEYESAEPQRNDAPAVDIRSANLSGSWAQKHSENVGPYLKGLGLGIVLRSAMALAPCTSTIRHQGDHMDITTVQIKAINVKCVVGGATVTSRVFSDIFEDRMTWEGAGLRCVKKNKGRGYEITADRRMLANGMLLLEQTVRYPGTYRAPISCKQFFERT
ncbi:hypothetical protein M885DRAFT_506886 [Pelagophyceae sp. CCMP2097]|nr:hypothetical protein M885DRAFT_506886 [Pelagophyceae sp. CCMP2097]